MSDQNNPYQGNGGAYATDVQFGEPAGDAARVATQPSVVNAQGADTGVGLIKDTTTANFTADVIQESRNQPVLVDFWAPWCGPCKQLTPTLEKVVNGAGGRVKLVKMNIDDHPSIAGQLGIQSIPAVIVFKDGQPVDGFMGAVPESQIKDLIKKIAGEDDGADQIAEALAAAATARDAGDAQTAAGLYSAILQQAPETIDAIAGMADLLFEAGERQRAIEVLDSAPPSKKDVASLAAVRAKISLAEEADALGGAAEFEARLGADPNDHDARFDLAMIQNAEDRREEAADNLLAIVKADRTWRDDGAKAQLLKFFEAWGPTDAATLAARRKLSAMLFS